MQVFEYLFKPKKYGDKLALLGQGVSGKVELYQSGDKKYAIKTYHEKEKFETKDEYKQRVLKEYNSLQKLHHINIVQVFTIEISSNGLQIQQVMEYFPFKLKQFIKLNNNLTELYCFFKQLCNGIKYLHEQEISHRDLKLDNLMVNNKGILKIIDFDAMTQNNFQSFGIVGSKKYLAPEVYSKLSYNPIKIDIWSIGIILYYMINRKYPWDIANLNDQNYNNFYNKLITIYEFQNTNNEKMTKDLIKFISKLLDVDPETRISIKEFPNFNWFKKIKDCNHTHHLDSLNTLLSHQPSS
ncbi:hypothetical protein PACTADRAFT_48782 [Pachysolen tannophilus NRRL Y-2460]|uniref:Protein kinase domain-containing protein n=1 Tax=Pachysolen tannophilus NRRL Y-2460 TaxID=669874 RepID=A0A1E4TZ01_PACTA|nr:hypothetical protein PACTADRAFT_48782 [Pachysolen tannophilus NRRL Y-2460]